MYLVDNNVNGHALRPVAKLFTNLKSMYSENE